MHQLDVRPKCVPRAGDLLTLQPCAQSAAAIQRWDAAYAEDEPRTMSLLDRLQNLCIDSEEPAGSWSMKMPLQQNAIEGDPNSAVWYAPLKLQRCEKGRRSQRFRLENHEDGSRYVVHEGGMCVTMQHVKTSPELLVGSSVFMAGCGNRGQPSGRWAFERSLGELRRHTWHPDLSTPLCLTACTTSPPLLLSEHWLPLALSGAVLLIVFMLIRCRCHRLQARMVPSASTSKLDAERV